MIWLLLMVGRVCTSTARRGPHHPRGETPVSQRHHHYRPRADTPLTHDSQLLHDTRHLAEDSRALTQEALEAMTPEELEFHYFSAHDYDSNDKLDGLELLKAVFHTMEHQDDDGDLPLEVDRNDIESYIELVDRTLRSDDTDGDGYVSYAEYRAVRASRPRDPAQNTPGHQARDQPHESRDKTLQAHQAHDLTQQAPGQTHQAQGQNDRGHQAHNHEQGAGDKFDQARKHLHDYERQPHERDDTPEVREV